MDDRPPIDPPRHSGLRRIGLAVVPLAGPVLDQPKSLIRLIAGRWPRMVGTRWAALTWPERVTFPPHRRADGTLHLKVATGAAALEMQHEEPALVRRINGTLGEERIARFKFTQGPLPGRPEADLAAPLALSREEEAALSKALAPVAEGSVRDALRALGQAIFAREPVDRRGGATPAPDRRRP